MQLTSWPHTKTSGLIKILTRNQQKCLQLNIKIAQEKKKTKAKEQVLI